MVALRIWPTSMVSFGPFWFSALCTAFTPTAIGYQDLAGLLARQPGVSQRWRDHLIASPLGTIDAATFSFALPIGTAMPATPLVQRANFDPSSQRVKVWQGNRAPIDRPAAEAVYPSVNRRLKGDRLPVQQAEPPESEQEHPPQLQPVDAPAQPQPFTPSTFTAPRPKTVEAPIAAPPRAENAPAAVEPLPRIAALTPATDPVLEAAPANPATTAIHSLTAVPPVTAIPRAVAAPVERDDARNTEPDDDAFLLDKPPEIPAAPETEVLEEEPPPVAEQSLLNVDPTARDAALYFGVGALGSANGLQQWAPGAAPVLTARANDAAIRLAALEGRDEVGEEGLNATGKDESQALSPAERLGLIGRARAKAEKCLADAVYFEARSEPLRGQEAVAQVVMNRTFSGYYPNDVCGVVYQNARRFLACQFTFACDGKRDVVNEPEQWEQAKRIAKDTLDGKIWLNEVGHATHYHAYWVHPYWAHSMKKMYKLGVHTFYRPRAWGDGSDMPAWGAALMTPRPEAANVPVNIPANVLTSTPASAGGSLVPTMTIPEAAISPIPIANKAAPIAKL